MDCSEPTSIPTGWYWLSLTYATGGIEVGICGCIRNTAPIFRWMNGRRFESVIAWLHQKGQLLDYEYIDGEDDEY